MLLWPEADLIPRMNSERQAMASWRTKMRKILKVTEDGVDKNLVIDY